MLTARGWVRWRAVRVSLLLAVVLSGIVGSVAYGQCREQGGVLVDLGPPSVLIVMDASKSMATDAGGGQTRLEVAKEALRTLVAELPADARVGLRLYGHRFADTSRERGCTDTELVQPVGPLDREELLGQIDSYEARGFTPIGRSLQEAADDLPDEGRNTIVLVSDGGDNCGQPGPCATAQQIAKDGTSVAIQAIGLQVTQGAREQLECIAERGGGVYRDADDAQELAVQLRALSARAVRTFEPTGEPVEGGETAGAATPIEPGAYTGEIGVGEERWYRLPLAEGQRLAASAALVRTCALTGSVGFASRFEMEFHDAAGKAIVPPGTNTVTSLFAAEELSVASVGLLGFEVDSSRGEFDPFNRPGPYLIRLLLGESKDLAEQLGGSRVPIELLVNVEGDAPAGAPAGSPPADDATPAREVSDEGDDGLLVALVAAGGLLLGAAVGATIMARRRPQAG